jgi:diguanylate cyclase (GGDEF)-like protein/PAS domain S-box-containing protein
MSRPSNGGSATRTARRGRAQTIEVEIVLEELRRSRQMLAEAQELARIGSWEWDVAANVVTWSDELFRIYGHPPQAFEPSYDAFLSHVHPDDRESVDARNHKAFADGQSFEDVKRVVRPDGSVFLMRTQGEVVTDPEGNVVRMVGICEDVTDRVRAEEAQELLASIVRSSTDAIYTMTRAGEVTSWNPAAQALFGHSEEEAVGHPAAGLFAGSAGGEEAQLVALALDAEPVDPYETVRRRKDGTHVPVSVSLSPIRDGRGEVTGVAVIARDITERRRFEGQLRYLADHDALTGLYNRRRFEWELDRAVEQGTRYGTAGAVLLLDLDNFKYVNDTAGHGGGDAVVGAVARLLRSRLRSTDVLARLGGDEFGVLLPHASRDDARALARELVSAVRDESVIVDGRRLRVTTSIGVAGIATGVGGEEVLACADAAMYAAKDAGRDRAVVFSPGDARRLRGGTNWEHRIITALEEDGFELYCQPILDLRTGETSRYEVLLRMTGANGELVLPGEFLPVAERLGLIHDIDRWVLREAIGLLCAHPAIELEVNLSGRSLDDEDLIAAIAAELEATGTDPTRLVLEITETATVANLDDARRFAESLTGLGCRFALDDFGAGFGSFTYLKHLPAAYLKIDGDFVSSPRSRTDELVIEAIVGMARGLGKSTIAEFVGDEATIEMLRAAGVDYAQGYHVGRPFPACELA